MKTYRLYSLMFRHPLKIIWYLFCYFVNVISMGYKIHFINWTPCCPVLLRTREGDQGDLRSLPWLVAITILPEVFTTRMEKWDGDGLTALYTDWLPPWITLKITRTFCSNTKNKKKELIDWFLSIAYNYSYLRLNLEYRDVVTNETDG